MPLRHPPHLRQELVGQNRGVRLAQPRRGEDVQHPLRRNRARDQPPQRVIQLLIGLPLRRRALRQRRPHRLEERRVVADAPRLLVRRRQRERLRQLPHRRQTPLLPVLLRQNVLLRRRQQRQTLLRRPAPPERAIKPMKQPLADLVLLDQRRHRVLVVQRRPTRPAALRVDRQRLLQVVRQTQIVHHPPAVLVLEHPIDPRDRLHQAVPPHRLVHVHRVQTRRVETGQPHIAHQHDPQPVFRIAETVRQRLAARLVADVPLPRRRIRRRARHHHLDLARLVVLAVPLRTQLRQFVVHVHADPPTRADHHRLARQRLQTLLEMLHDVLRDLPHPRSGAHHRLQLRPARLQPLLRC